MINSYNSNEKNSYLECNNKKINIERELALDSDDSKAFKKKII